MTERLFLLFIASLPIVRYFNSHFFGMIIPISDLIFAVAAGSWVLDLLRGRTPWHRSTFYRPLALFFIALCVSTFLSENPTRSTAKLIGELYLITAAVMTVHMVTSWTQLRSVVNAWLIGTAISVVVGTCGVALFYAGIVDPKINIALGHYGSLPSGPYPRIQALFVNQNMLCNYLSVGVMLLLLARELGWVKTVTFWVLAILTSITALFTLSPGLGGIALSVGIWEYVRRPPERRGLAVHALLLGGVTAAVLFVLLLLIFPTPPGETDDFTIPIVGVGMHLGPRLSIWEAALPTFLADPIFGRGVGMEAVSFRRTLPTGDSARFTDAHNMFLSIASQEGIVGLAAFLFIVVHLCRRFLPLPSGGSPRAAAMVAVGLAFICSLLYQGLSGSFEDARHVWVLMGLIVAIDERLLSPA